MARLEEEKKKKKKGCERKKISGRNTEKRMPLLPPLHPPPRPPRSRTESEWIALLLRGGEERLQDLRENRSSSFKTLLRVGWKEGEKFVIPLFDLPRNRCSSFRYTYSRNESSSLELIEIFPPLLVTRNIFKLSTEPPLLLLSVPRNYSLRNASTRPLLFPSCTSNARLFNYDSDRN